MFQGFFLGILFKNFNKNKNVCLSKSLKALRGGGMERIKEDPNHLSNFELDSCLYR